VRRTDRRATAPLLALYDDNDDHEHDHDDDGRAVRDVRVGSGVRGRRRDRRQLRSWLQLRHGLRMDWAGTEAAAVDVPLRVDHDHDDDNDDNDNDHDDDDDDDDDDNDKHDNGTALLHRCVHVCLDGRFVVADEQYMLRFWLLLLAAIDLWNDGRRDARRHLRRVVNTPWPISGTLGR
jgi:hypothetical protein